MHIRRLTLLVLASHIVLALAAAYVQWATVGLQVVSPAPALDAETAAEPSGFPALVRVTHYVNFLFLVLLVRSGLQILADHPRLYWNAHCTPGTEWVWFTAINSWNRHAISYRKVPGTSQPAKQ
jgi:hypothetical protein